MQVEQMTQDELVEEWMRAIGKERSELRDDKGISQDDMGDILGFSRSTMYKLEKGTSPTLPKYLRYALELDVDFALIAARARLTVRARSMGEGLLP